MQVDFKIANVEDVENIVNLCNECFEEQTDLAKAKKIFFHVQHDNNQVYVVGYYKDILVAHAKLTIIPTIFEPMGTFSILNHVCVKPDYRRHDIASHLLVECEKISKERGCNAVHLWSMNFRVPAHECYKKYGFEVVDAKFFSKKI